jgi:hypothetical protein
MCCTGEESWTIDGKSFQETFLPAFIDGACCIAEHNLVIWRRIGTLNKG